MQCVNCGTIFDEGSFCPECGTKCNLDVNVENENNTQKEAAGDAFSKADSILNEYERIEKEKKIISEIGWSTEKDLTERVIIRSTQFNEIRKRELRTDYAKQVVKKMAEDLKMDYEEVEKKSIAKQSALAIFWTIIALSFLFPLGIIGIIIGVLLIIGGWKEVIDVKKAKKLKEELECFL